MKISEKGKAVLIAIECGLCPKTQDGYDDRAFNLFWDRYAKTLHKQILLRGMYMSLCALFIAIIALLNSL